MNKKDNSQDYGIGTKGGARRRQHTQENMKEQYERKGSDSSTKKGRWISMGRR